MRSQLERARELFDSLDFPQSLDLFESLLRAPRIRMHAARVFTDLFLTFAEQGCVLPAISRIWPMLKLSFEVLQRASDRGETRTREARVRTALSDSYGLILSAALPMPRAMDELVHGNETLSSKRTTRSSPKSRKKGKGLHRDKVFANVQVLRTPHMAFTPEPILSAGHTFSVTVFADKTPAHPGEDSSYIVLDGGQNTYWLKVHLLVPSEMSVIGPESKLLTILADKDRSDDATFQVRVDCDLTQKQTVAITAIFSYEGRPSGRVTRVLTTARENGRVPRNSIRVPPVASKPDLTVAIVAKPDNGQYQFLCTVSTPHITEYKEGISGDWPVMKSAPALINGYIARLKDFGVSAKQRKAALRAAGLRLFIASPDVFQRVFWELADRRMPPKTMLIVSEETAFPWELMIPNRSSEQWQCPLGVEMAVGRWLTSDYDSPNQAIEIRDAYIIAPDYSGDRELKFGDDEIRTVTSCFANNGRQVPEIIRPPDVDTIDGRLEQQVAPH